jgi:hypothetical protein
MSGDAFVNHSLARRLRFWKEALWSPVTKLAYLIMATLWLLESIRDELLPSWYQEKFRLLNLIPRWQWRTRLILILALLLAALLEGSYREFASVETQLENYRSKNCLEIVFNDGVKPYFEEQPTGVMPGGVLSDRRFRVGIKNACAAVVSKARLVLEQCDPSESSGIHLGHPFQVMGQPSGTSEFSVQPGDLPSVFIDVVYDELMGGSLHGDAFGLCYAASITNAILRGSYALTLRLEGDGMLSRKKFKIAQELVG